MKRTIERICLFTLACGMLAGCTKEGGEGSAIQFIATSSSVATRTSYSGVVNNNLERIDWTVGDKFTIVTGDEAVYHNDPRRHWCDYVVQTVREEGDHSAATVQSVDANGLVWNRLLARPPYHFYARYPAEIRTFASDYSYMIFEQPSTQVLVDVSRRGDYQPKMSEYGFMYGYALARNTTDRVKMLFKPEFTALQFVIGGGGNAAVDLSQFTLSSTSSPLSGGFSVKCDERGTVEVSEDALKKIVVDFRASFPNGKLTIKDQPVSITFFALPADLTNLTLTITGTGIGTRRLALNDSDGNPIQFDACKKYVIKGLNLPELLNATGEDINWDVEAKGESIYWD